MDSANLKLRTVLVEKNGGIVVLKKPIRPSIGWVEPNTFVCVSFDTVSRTYYLSFDGHKMKVSEERYNHKIIEIWERHPKWDADRVLRESVLDFVADMMHKWINE